MLGWSMTRQRRSFRLEAGEDLARVHPGPDDLDGDLALERLGLRGQEDGAHAALAELPLATACTGRILCIRPLAVRIRRAGRQRYRPAKGEKSDPGRRCGAGPRMAAWRATSSPQASHVNTYRAAGLLSIRRAALKTSASSKVRRGHDDSRQRRVDGASVTRRRVPSISRRSHERV